MLGLIGSLVLRAARDAHRDNLSVQEHVVKAYLTALAIGDVCFPIIGPASFSHSLIANSTCGLSPGIPVREPSKYAAHVLIDA